MSPERRNRKNESHPKAHQRVRNAAQRRANQTRKSTTADEPAVRKDGISRPDDAPGLTVFVRKYGLILAIGLLVVYSISFISRPLPDLPAATEDGKGILRAVLVEILLAELPMGYVGGWGADEFGFAVLLDRLVVVALACIVTGVAWALGRLVLFGLSLCGTLSTLERSVFALAIGWQLHSLLILAVGLAGAISPVGIGVAYMVSLLSLGLLAIILRRRQQSKCPSDHATSIGLADDAGVPTDENPFDSSTFASTLYRVGISLCLVFAALTVFRATLAPTDFDVLEYHLQVPKEWYQAGIIEAVPHNVYGNMPLGAELHSVACMAFSPRQPEWWWGALAGKTLMSFYTLATGLALLAMGLRFQSKLIGVLAATLYLSTPWVVQTGVKAWNENAYGFYLLIATYAVLLAVRGRASLARRQLTQLLAISGFCAGAAISTKYPAVLFVALPIATWIIALPILCQRRWLMVTGDQVAEPNSKHDTANPGASSADESHSAQSKLDHRQANRGGRGSVEQWQAFGWRGVIVFAVACLVSCGGWFGKNAVLTGNPTYPLLGGVFGNRTVTQAENWQVAHQMTDNNGFGIARLISDVDAACVGSQWLSPALIPLALLGLIRFRRNLVAVLPVSLFLCSFAIWWLLTHRIERFLVPAYPMLAWLAAFGVATYSSTVWRWCIGLFLAMAMAYNVCVGFGPIYQMGNPLLLASYETQRQPSSESLRDQSHALLNRTIGERQRVLLVADAAVFDLEVGVLYNTCFDECWLEKLVAERSPEVAWANLREHRVSHVFVNWSELNRYRAQGSYGYSEFVSRETVDQLVRDGVMRELPSEIPQAYGQLYQLAEQSP